MLIRKTALIFSIATLLQGANASLVVGHVNPDVDAVTSAIAFADFLKRTGIDKEAEAVTQGRVNAETAFVLKTCGVATPRVISEAGAASFFLTDTTELSQAPKGMKSEALRGILDHHRLGDATSASPLYVWMAPYGSSNTVLYKQYRALGLIPTKQIAGLMLSGVLSDTIGLRSPTTTEADREAVKSLSRIAAVKVEAYTKELLAVKADVSRFSDEELLMRDGKLYTFGGMKLWVAQVETIDLRRIYGRVAGFRKAMRALRREKGYEAVFLALTDIEKCETAMLVDAKDADLVQKLWQVPVTEHGQDLRGVTSRKKQIVPVLQRHFGG